MRKTIISIVAAIGLVVGSNVAYADTAKPGASMTHMKTAAGVASTLEAGWSNSLCTRWRNICCYW